MVLPSAPSKQPQVDILDFRAPGYDGNHSTPGVRVRSGDTHGVRTGGNADAIPSGGVTASKSLEMNDQRGEEAVLVHIL